MFAGHRTVSPPVFQYDYEPIDFREASAGALRLRFGLDETHSNSTSWGSLFVNVRERSPRVESTIFLDPETPGSVVVHYQRCEAAR